MMAKRVSYLDEHQPLEGYLAAPDFGAEFAGRPGYAQLAERQRVDL